MTLLELRTALKTRLNDVDGGSYTVTELNAYINEAIKFIELQTRCYSLWIKIPTVIGVEDYTTDVLPWSAAKSIELNDLVVPVAGNSHYYKCTAIGTTHATTEPTWPTNGSTVTDGTVTWQDMGTNDPPSIFDIQQVSFGSAILEPVRINELAFIRSLRGVSGTPTRWWKVTGTQFRLIKTPDSVQNCAVYGWATSGSLSADTDTIVSMTDAVQSTVLLDSAEYSARKARATDALNVQLVPVLAQQVMMWIQANKR